MKKGEKNPITAESVTKQTDNGRPYNIAWSFI
jgi:hypothetical protein